MARACHPAALALVLAASAVPPLAAQTFNRYEAQYGRPVDVALSDLVQNSAAYEGRAVRTKGRVDFLGGGGGGRQYVLSELFGQVRIFPMSEIAGEFDREVMSLVGRELQVTGVFRSDLSSGGFGSGAPVGTIAIWSYVGPPDPREKQAELGSQTTLEALVSNPGSRDGTLVRVVGKFRGSNLYGDLPVRSQRDRDDWVIKDELYAVWVSGKKPKGDGWHLDKDMKRDTNKWIEVVGEPETRNGVTYVRARSVALSAPPTPTARVEPPPPPPEVPKVPPVVVFALPLDGEVVPQQSRFVVQFSKDMKVSTFDGRVELRYTGPVQPGDRGFGGLTLSYDLGRRALTVDPGDLLRPGRQLELLLYPGIADIDGLTLQPRPGVDADEAVDVLRFEVGT